MQIYPKRAGPYMKVRKHAKHAQTCTNMQIYANMQRNAIHSENCTISESLHKNANAIHAKHPDKCEMCKHAQHAKTCRNMQIQAKHAKYCKNM